MEDITAELLAKYSRKALIAETERFTRPVDREKALIIRKRYGKTAQAAGDMAKDLSITEKHAKALMKDAHAQEMGAELYDVGKELEAAYHAPVAEAQKAEREAARAERLQRKHGPSPA